MILLMHENNFEVIIFIPFTPPGKLDANKNDNDISYLYKILLNIKKMQ